MTRTLYINVSDVNDLQRTIMLYVDVWVKTEKTPIPLKAIIQEMKGKGVHDFTTINAINSLCHKGYLRRSELTSNKTFFVQLRRV